MPSSPNEIYDAIATEGFSPKALKLINDYSNDIENGRANFSRYTLPEHAGLCTAGSVLVGASIVADYARTSLTASCNASSGQSSSPANWQIDERQEQLVFYGWMLLIILISLYASKVVLRVLGVEDF